MQITKRLILLLSLFLLAHIAFAGCGQSDMLRVMGQLISEAHNTYQIPGLQFSVICPGENTVHDYVSGYADVMQAVPMNQNHLFQVGSNTKAFVSTVVLQLESEGKLSIHDPISRYIQHLPESWQAVTIEQILNHTSGLPDYLLSPEFASTLKATEGAKQWAADELIDLVRETPLYFKPGNNFRYSQTNYILAGKLVEAVTQNMLEDELNQRIIFPLQLKNTVYAPFSYDEALLQRMAHGYSVRGFFPDEPKDVTYFNMSGGGAAGAMLSTAHDMALWTKKLFTSHLLPHQQQQEMQHLIDIENGQYLPANSAKRGYGMGITGMYQSPVGSVWGGNGMTLGYIAGAIYLPCNDIVISYAFNRIGRPEMDESLKWFLFRVVLAVKSFDKKQCPKFGLAHDTSDLIPFFSDEVDATNLSIFQHLMQPYNQILLK